MNYDEALHWLYELQFFGMKLGLENTLALLKELDNPYKKLQVIHVAGTNGKGSVCAFVSSVLKEAGYRVGTYTSPHLLEYGERISINGYPMKRSDFVRSVERIKPIIEKLANLREPKKCTFFETSTAIALDHFARKKVDFAVLEVGMGGRLDSTNIVDPLACAITNIGFEHTQHLGRTLKKIAGEKAGIIKKGRPVVSGVRKTVPAKVIEWKAKEMKAPLTLAHDVVKVEVHSHDIFGISLSLKSRSYDITEVRIRLAGRHQVDNLAVAVALIEELGKADFEISEDVIKSGLEKARWNGRLQVCQHSPTVIVDCTHNPLGAKTLRAMLDDELAGRDIVGVVGMVKDKDHLGFFTALEDRFSNLFVTSPEYDRGVAPEDLAVVLKDDSYELVDYVAMAIERAVRVAKKKDIILVTGSLFTASDGLEHLAQRKIRQIFRILKKSYPIGAFPGKEVGDNETTLKKLDRNPFNVLIGTILSQRTRDENTYVASQRLFAKYSTPEELANADLKVVEELIKPAGFYKNKAQMIIAASRALVDNHDSKVPDELDDLLALPGVGRKTANCVLVYGYKIPAMPVDTHVHRISNLWGLVNTMTADETEDELVRIIPKKYWIDINRLMVRHGQVVCKSTGPRCLVCQIADFCNYGIYQNRRLD